MALACLLAGLWLSSHYPRWPALAAALLVLSSAAAYRWADRWPWLMLAPLPLLGFAPWTGWISFEELDLLVLSVAAGGYLARARPGLHASARPLLWTPGQALLLLAYAASLGLAVQRGLEDAGGFGFGWFQGYLEPMNSLRAAKAFFWVLLLLPVWSRAARLAERGGIGFDRLVIGSLCLYLLAASLPALAERWAYTGLLNFSADYRTTGSFWEMHVGGATLDGALALGLPFVLAGLLRFRSPRLFAPLLVLALLAAYVVLTSFSRGLYLALLLSTLLLLWLWWRGHVVPRQQAHRLARLRGLALVLAMALVAAWLLFPAGGYRVVLALLLCLMALLGTRREPGDWTALQRGLVLFSAAVLGIFLSLASAGVAARVPKSAYVLSLLASLLCLLLGRRGTRLGVLRELLMWAAWYWSLGQVAVVAWSWSGSVELSMVAWPLLGLALMPLLAGRPAWQLEGLSWRVRGAALGLLLLGAMLVGSLLGGAYLGSRLGTTDRDMGTRSQHWRQGLALLEGSTQQWWGRGAGRFASANFFAAAAGDQGRPGDYRVVSQDGKNALVLTAGTHTLGWGELLRVSQRVDAPEGPITLRARLRAEQDLSFHAELCNKHLLYDDGCIDKTVAVKAKPGQWQDLTLVLGQRAQWGGRWYAPESVVFSVALPSRGRMLMVSDLRLSDARGRELLRNGDFGAEMAYWLFSSDKLHLPWHMKSLPLHVLFEQGLVGLGLWSALLWMALWRLSLGPARKHELAPALAAALLGFLVVGLFDSLIDAPRAAFMFYALLLLALGLQAPADMMRGPKSGSA